nr:MAG TPA: hypothetical protein [Caudoviricetes sp.]
MTRKTKKLVEIKKEALRKALENFNAGFYHENAAEESEMEKFVNSALFNHEDLAEEIKFQVRNYLKNFKNSYYYSNNQTDEYYIINTEYFKDHVELLKSFYDDYKEADWDYYRSLNESFGKYYK